MKNSFYSQEHLGRIQIHSKPKLKNLIQSYYFYEFSNKFDIKQVKVLFQNIANSEILIISKCQINDDNIFLIIIYQNTIIIIKISLLYLLAPLFNIKTDLKLYFLQNTRSIFNQQMQNVNCNIKIQIECDESIDEEIKNFNKQIYTFKITEFEYPEMYLNIENSIIRYLIQESYNKLNKEQIVDFSNDFVFKTDKKKNIIVQKWDDDEYIDLKILGSGSASTVKLVYQIEDKKLYAIKMQNVTYNDDNEEYLTREYKNYFNIQYPLLPKLYGIYKLHNYYYLKIQFINGKTLQIKN